MQQINKKLNRTQLAVYSLILIVCSLCFTPARAATSCEHIEIEANIALTGILIPGQVGGEGTLTWTFGDRVLVTEAHPLILAGPIVSDDGTIHLVVQQHAAFNDEDSMTWIANQVLAPTEIPGELRVNERISLITGTGLYQEAIGKGTGHGDLSFNQLTASLRSKAKLCDAAQ